MIMIKLTVNRDSFMSRDGDIVITPKENILVIQSKEAGSWIALKQGPDYTVRETPKQILAMIGGAPQLPEEWMAAANTAHDIKDVLQRLESNFDDSKPEAIKRCISSLVKDAVSLEATLHAIPGRSNP